MKITTRYIVGIVILVVGLFTILLIRPSRFVWTPTFAHEDKNPFGCFVFDSVMVQTMPRGYKATGATLRETVADSSSNNVLIVARDGKLTDANITDIKRLLKRGSTVMLVGVDIYEDSNADKAFGLQCITYANFFYNEIKTSSPITATTSMTPSTIGRSTRTPMAPNATVFPVASPIPMPTTAYTKRSSPVLSISILQLQSIAAITS